MTPTFQLRLALGSALPRVLTSQTLTRFAMVMNGCDLSQIPQLPNRMLYVSFLPNVNISDNVVLFWHNHRWSWTLSYYLRGTIHDTPPAYPASDLRRPDHRIGSAPGRGLTEANRLGWPSRSTTTVSHPHLLQSECTCVVPNKAMRWHLLCGG